MGIVQRAKLKRLRLSKSDAMKKKPDDRITLAAPRPSTVIINNAPKVPDRATLAALGKPIVSANRPPTPQEPEAIPISQFRARIKLRTPSVQMPMLASSTLEERIAGLHKTKLLLPNRIQTVRKAIQRYGSPSSSLAKAKRFRKRLALSEAMGNLAALNGDVRELQQIIGLQGLALAKPDVTFVSLDLEWLSMMHRDRITEIGVTILKAKDIIGLDPGAFAENWHAKMRHEHIFIPGARRCSISYFGETCAMSFDQAKSWLRDLLKEISDSGPVAMVGQSVDGDIAMLASALQFQLQLKDIIGSGYKIFDTYRFGQRSQDLGSRHYTLKLGSIANHLGIPHKYRIPASVARGAKRIPTFVGAHNASNDAAVSMMCLLLFALRWNEVTSPGQEVLNYDWHETGYVRSWDAVPVADTREGWENNEKLMKTSGTPWEEPPIEDGAAKKQGQEGQDDPEAQREGPVRSEELPRWLRNEINKNRQLKQRRKGARHRLADEQSRGRNWWKWPSIAAVLMAGGYFVTQDALQVIKYIAG